MCLEPFFERVKKVKSRNYSLEMEKTPKAVFEGFVAFLSLKLQDKNSNEF